METAMSFQESKVDDEEFDRLYKLFYKPGITFLYSIVKDKEEAENMLQDVFLKIWLRREKLELNISLQPYIFTSLRNCAFDYLKKLQKDQALKSDFLQRVQQSDKEDNLTEASAGLIAKAIDKLSEKRRMIIKLNIEEGKSYEEIARLMHISKNTVKNQLIKAKQHLRNSIEYPLSVH